MRQRALLEGTDSHACLAAAEDASLAITVRVDGLSSSVSFVSHIENLAIHLIRVYVGIPNILSFEPQYFTLMSNDFAVTHPLLMSNDQNRRYSTKRELLPE